MNENLQNALADLIMKGTNTLESAGKFLLSEMPEAIQQLLIWYGIESFLFFCLGFVVIIISIMINKKMTNFIKTMNDKDEDKLFCSIVRYIIDILGFVFGLLYFYNNLEWLQILIAPKIWLIEYASALIN